MRFELDRGISFTQAVALCEDCASERSSETGHHETSDGSSEAAPSGFYVSKRKIMGKLQKTNLLVCQRRPRQTQHKGYGKHNENDSDSDDNCDTDEDTDTDKDLLLLLPLMFLLLNFPFSTLILYTHLSSPPPPPPPSYIRA